MKVYFSAVAALLVSSIVSAEGGNDSRTAGVLEAVGDVGEENKQPVFCGVSSYDQQRILNCTIASNEKVNSTLQDYINRFGANHTVIAAGICNNATGHMCTVRFQSCVAKARKSIDRISPRKHSGITVTAALVSTCMVTSFPSTFMD
uniref:Putative ixodes 14 kDa protein n=1 Tax=Ixodes ricinus TaxID=34613 RepID=A0A0K8R5A3_IXORI